MINVFVFMCVDLIGIRQFRSLCARRKLNSSKLYMRELASLKREEVEIPFFNSDVFFKNIINDNLLNVCKILCRSRRQ